MANELNLSTAQAPISNPHQASINHLIDAALITAHDRARAASAFLGLKLYVRSTKCIEIGSLAFFVEGHALYGTAVHSCTHTRHY